MKLKILNDFKLAKPETWMKPWDFKKDEIVDTDNEYLIERLLHYKAADIVEKVAKEPKKESKPKKAKAHKAPKNKMYVPEKEDK